MTLTDTPEQAQLLPAAAGRKRRRLPGFAWASLLLLAVALLVAALARAGRAVELATAAGPVRQLVATPEGLFWIEDAAGAQGSRILFLNRVGGQAEVLARGEAFVAFVAQDQHLLVLDAGPAAPSVHSPRPNGCLLRLPRAGGTPEVIAQGLRNPAGLWADDQGIFWTETYPPRAPAVPHVAALGHVSLLRLLPAAGGPPRLVARLAGTGPEFEGQLLGRHEGRFLWMEPRRGYAEPGVTLMRAVSLQMGTPSTRWVGEGPSRAALGDEAVYATDVSTEASPVGLYASVHRHPLAGGERTLLTDWLNPRGWLLAREGAVYHLSDRLHQVPDTLDWPRLRARDLNYPVAADVAGGFLYLAKKPATAGLPGAGGEPPAPELVVRQPLTLGARLRGLVRRW